MKIAILTGGGDCPGLNSAIKGLALGALHAGWEVVGIRNGWLGLLALDMDDPSSVARWTVPLSGQAVRAVDRSGGTFLHTSRTNPAAVKDKDLPPKLKAGQGTAGAVHDCTTHVLHNLAALKVDALFPIGGDDTLSFGERLYKEGFAVIGIPKTMDNDVHGTDYCLGFATAVSRSVAYLHDLRTCTASHERYGVVECMGRNAGFTALVPAYVAGVDRALIAEVPFDVDHLAELLARDKRTNPSRYAMLTVSEGASMRGAQVVERGEADAFGHRKLGGIGAQLSEALKARSGEGVIYQNLGYLVRSGPPDPVDVMVTFNFAHVALELAKAGKFGNLVRVHRGVYGYAPMSILSEGVRRVDVETMYDVDNLRPALRSALGMSMYM